MTCTCVTIKNLLDGGLTALLMQRVAQLAQGSPYSPRAVPAGSRQSVFPKLLGFQGSSRSLPRTAPQEQHPPKTPAHQQPPEHRSATSRWPPASRELHGALARAQRLHPRHCHRVALFPMSLNCHRVLEDTVRARRRHRPFGDHLIEGDLEDHTEQTNHTLCARVSCLCRCLVRKPLRNRSPMQLGEQFASSSPRRCKIKHVTT